MLLALDAPHPALVDNPTPFCTTCPAVRTPLAARGISEAFEGSEAPRVDVTGVDTRVGQHADLLVFLQLVPVLGPRLVCTRGDECIRCARNQ